MGEPEALFFWRDSTRNAIKRLVDAKRVTLVVGAGASAEVGYPTWSELVERLLLRALDPSVEVMNADYSEAVREAAARAITDGGVLGAATMARAALGDNFTEELHACLYRWPDEWRWAAPGATAQAVAKLFATMTDRQDEDCEVLTTNYDLNLEEAMEDELGVTVTGFAAGHEPPPGEIVVRHLHGILTEDGQEQAVALTEADYHTADPSGIPWQENYLRHRFRDSTVVFIGASLTDQDLLRYIFRYAEEEVSGFDQGPRPLAILVPETTAGTMLDQRRTLSESDELLAALEEGRWEFAHLTAIKADYPAQPAQLLHEVVHHKTSENFRPYGERLNHWFDALYSERLGLKSKEDFLISQAEMQEILEEWLTDISGELEAAGYDLSEEALEVHLWCRSPRRLRHDEDPGGPMESQMTALAMVGCSDRVWHDPRALDVRQITQPSSRAAVDAFCWGTPQVQMPWGMPKWRLILATPVLLEDEVHGRLPVGAITLVSDLDPDDGVLHKLQKDNRELLQRVERFLAAGGADVLMPSYSDRAGD